MSVAGFVPARRYLNPCLKPIVLNHWLDLRMLDQFYHTKVHDTVMVNVQSDRWFDTVRIINFS